MSKIIIIIPARLESVRLPNKVLLDICGQPMLQRVWQAAINTQANAVYITTDNSQIADVAEQFGAQVLLSGQHNSGTERIAEVITRLNLDNDDIVINLQGDEPLMPPRVLDELAIFAGQRASAACSIYSDLTDAIGIDDPNCVKVVCDQQNRALYFSRSKIPSGPEGFRMHHGVYAYRVSLLKSWDDLPVGPLEQSEKLEQLRLLENGQSISMLKASQRIPAGVDTSSNLQQVRKIFKQQQTKMQS